jgi:hypothetical protein
VRDAVDASCQALLRKTTDVIAYDEVVWSWHPGADAKLAMMLRIAPMTGAIKPVPGESSKETVKTTAQGRPG